MFLRHTEKLAFAAVIGLCSLATANVITFDAASDVDDNFRSVRGTWAWSSTEAGVLLGASDYRSTLLYDSTPGDGAATVDTFGDIKLSVDVKPQKDGSNIGFHVRHNGTTGIRVETQAKLGNAWDRHRGSFGVDPSDWNSAGTNTYDQYSNSTSLPETDWLTLQLQVHNVDLGNGGEQVQITLSMIQNETVAWEDTFELSVADSADYLNPGELGLFSSGGADPDQTLIDNFRIIPEPASIGLLSLAGILAYRRRH